MAPSPVRVFALPLTRSSVRSSATSQPLPTIYYHVSQHVAPSTSSDSTSATRSDKDLIWNQPSTWPSGSVAKASSLWLSWGTKPTYSDPTKQTKTFKERTTEWKYWTWMKGEGLMDRVEWEEWALKSINPSVRVGEEGAQGQQGVERKDEVGVKVVDPVKKEDAPRIPFLIPNHPSLDPKTVIPQLHTYLTHRIPYHKKYMTRSLLLTPLMLPFGLLPVVPNFPFLIAAWRAFSHYRAWRGAEWLLKLVEGGKMEVKVDEGLHEALLRSDDRAVGNAEDKEDHAPDETSTPKSSIFGAGDTGGGSIEGENAIQKTDALLDGGAAEKGSSGTSEPGSGVKADERMTGDAAAIPDPAKKDVAPDATATPESLIYKPSSSTKSSSSTTSTSTAASTSNEPVLEFENIAKLTSTFGLSASEVVDLTRAVMQIKEKAKKAAEGGQ